MTVNPQFPPKRKAGRPSNESLRQLEDGKREIQTLLELYENGATDVEVCAKLKINSRAFDKRMKEDDAFAQLVEYGRLACKAWWLMQGRTNIHNKNFNYSVWFANMSNR